MVLLKNLLLAREPLYGVPQWAARCDPAALGLAPQQIAALNDDRIGRCLDQLFRSDCSSLGADRQRIANSGGSFIRHRITPLNVSRSRHVQRRLVATPACTARRESVPGEWRRRAVIEWRSTDFSANL